MALYENINYTANISYLTNTFITEYDISKANINVLYEAGVIKKDIYEYLYSAERMERQKFVGMLQKNNHDIVRVLQQGIKEAKRKLFTYNNVKDYDVLSIRNDAVFIINRKLNNTEFGLIKFLPKNIYTSFYKINYKLIDLEFYYYYNNIDKTEMLDIKGLSNDNYKLHENYFIQLLKDIFYSIQVSSPEVSLRMIKDIYNKYISLEFPIEYYRKFNYDSNYHLMIYKNSSTGYWMNNPPDNFKPLLDISYNLQIIIELQKIVSSIYFNR